ncbi:MAG: DUF4368 domain-containing protein, partial [Eubacteriales bacterium]|nr:DUF4368 domain-containing protein [Eubacteriales bacterium]
YIRYEVLYAHVLERLQGWIELAQQDEEALLQTIMKSRDQAKQAERKKLATEYRKSEKRRAEIDNLFARMYEDWSAGRITEHNFNMLSQKYQNEQLILEEKLEAMKTELDSIQDSEADARNWIDLVRQYNHPTELTAELLNALIDRIYIYEATYDEDGNKLQKIEIHYKFIGNVA